MLQQNAGPSIVNIAMLFQYKTMEPKVTNPKHHLAILLRKLTYWEENLLTDAIFVLLETVSICHLLNCAQCEFSQETNCLHHLKAEA